MLRTVTLLVVALASVALAQQPIGSDKCTWGPSYWCSNLSNANECGALSTCQKMGLLLDTPAPLGANRCTWGPVYSCANEENAKQCNMLAACQQMGMLPAPGSAGSSGSTGEARRSLDGQAPLGVNKCTYGPTYWCATVDQANECHALKHCQAMGLLMDATIVAQDKPLGASKCTQGPSYWCASTDNANECKMLAHCQSLGLLTDDSTNTNTNTNTGVNQPLVSMPGMMLGNCAKGPIYWCASAANAKECQMEAQCAALGLNPPTEAGRSSAPQEPQQQQQQQEMLLGTNKCTLGPIYWCLSVENANKCKMLEECKRLNMLPADAIAVDIPATEAPATEAPSAADNSQTSSSSSNPQVPNPMNLGASKCTQGPSYWCASVDNANECKMLVQCQAMKMLPSDDVLSGSNIVRRAVKPVLGSKQCSDGPSYWCASLDNANECKMLAHCQSLGLLPKTESAAAQPNGVHPCLSGPIYWCANMENAKECNKLDHCRSIGLLSLQSPAAALPNKLAGLNKDELKGVECDVCEEVMKIVDEVLETNSTESVVLEGLMDLCKDLPSSLTSECTYFVSSYGPEIVNFLITNILAPQSICSEIGLCTKDPKISMALRTALRERFAGRLVLKGTECDICKDVMGALQSALQTPATIQDILTDIEEICDSAGALKSVCVSFIKEFGPQVLSYIAGEIDPMAFCTDIGVCSAQRMLNGVPFPPQN